MKKTQSSSKELLKWVSKFSDVPVLVVGDLMLDRTLKGTVDRISPEAPVPVVNIQDETSTAGGAGNVIFNLSALGASPVLLSVRGDDESGRQLESLFESRGIDVSGLVVDPSRQTTTKTRVIANHQQVTRLDVEKRMPLSLDSENQLIDSLRRLTPQFRVVLISDYGKGVVTKKVIQSAIREAHRHGAAVIVDPKIENFLNYKNVDCLTPNTKEAIEGMRVLSAQSDEEVISLGWKIMKKLKSASLLMTRGEKGMALFEKKGPVTFIPTQARAVFDVTGAGDTVVSTFSLARAVGAPYKAAAEISNYAASLVVAQLGTAVATRKELIELLKTI